MVPTSNPQVIARSLILTVSLLSSLQYYTKNCRLQILIPKISLSQRTSCEIYFFSISRQRTFVKMLGSNIDTIWFLG